MYILDNIVFLKGDITHRRDSCVISQRGRRDLDSHVLAPCFICTILHSSQSASDASKVPHVLALPPQPP